MIRELEDGTVVSSRDEGNPCISVIEHVGPPMTARCGGITHAVNDDLAVGDCVLVFEIGAARVAVRLCEVS